MGVPWYEVDGNSSTVFEPEGETNTGLEYASTVAFHIYVLLNGGQ